nr:MAG TPA: hypothetical protein [Crassvirales sp.]
MYLLLLIIINKNFKDQLVYHSNIGASFIIVLFNCCKDNTNIYIMQGNYIL